MEWQRRSHGAGGQDCKPTHSPVWTCVEKRRAHCIRMQLRGDILAPALPGQLMGIQIKPSPALAPPLPAWVEDFSWTRFRHATARFDGARAMDILTFQQRVVEAY